VWHARRVNASPGFPFENRKITRVKLRSLVPSSKWWLTLRAPAASWTIILTGLIAIQGATALVLIIVARQVSPVEYGQYLSTYGLLSLLIVLPNFGLDAWVLATGHATTAAWRKVVGFRARLLLLWFAGIIVLGRFLPADSFPPDLVLLTAVGLAFDSLALLSYAGLRVQGFHQRVAAMQFVSSIALLAVTLLLPLGVSRITLFALGRTIVSVGAALVAMIAARQLYDRARIAIPVRGVLRAARPFASAELAAAVYLKADLTLVAWFLGPLAAGIYGPALNLTNLTFMVPNALYLLVVPVLAREYRTSRPAFRHLGTRQFIAQAAVGLVMSVGLFVLAPFMINLVFGPAYRASAVILRILSPIPFLKCLNFGSGALLSTSGCQSQRATMQVLCAGFNVSANLMIIGTYGVGGVALVYTFSELFLFLGYAFTVLRQWKSRFRYNSSTELNSGT
jgi:O-antigen/teichoic acid export membrane protein